METRKLNSGYEIPLLGFGTWQLYGQECVDSIQYAINVGYRHIDTASMYRNEREIGRAIKGSNIDRSEIFITSKVWRTDLGRKDTMKSFQDSLDDLDTDYLDLYLIHWPGNNPAKRLESYKVMMELREKGKVHSIGVSNFSTSQIDEIYNEYGEYPAVNQIHFNPFHVNFNNLEYCRSKDIILTAYTPLNEGKGLDHPKLMKLAKRYNKKPSQIILRWYLDQNIATIPKSATPKHIESNADIFDFSLTDEEVQSLIAL